MSTAQSGRSIEAVEQANFNHLVLETIWFGTAAATTNQFLSIYAIRLGATPLQLGWLSSLPSLVLLASTWLATGWRNRSDDSAQAILLPSLGRRLAFLLLALTPFLPPGWQIAWLIFSVSLPAIPQSIVAIINATLWREAVGDHRLTRLLSRRSIGSDMAVGVSGLAFGLWLERTPFPVNYQVMYSVAFVLALMSLWHLNRIRIVSSAPAQTAELSVTHPWRSSGFQRVFMVTAMAYIAFYAMKPVIPLRLVNELGAAEGFMAVFESIRLVASITIALFTHRIVRRIGNQTMIALAMMILTAAFLTMALAPDLTIALLPAALAGAGWTMVSIGLFGFLAENTPADTHYTTAFQQTAYLAAALGPMIGSTLADRSTGLLSVLLIGAALQFLAGVVTRYGIR
jgi:predicted MFS family arabinose efflux permease